MTAKEWIAAVGIVFSMIAAAVGYGNMASQVEDAREEIRLLRAEMSAINQHFIAYTLQHREDDARPTPTVRRGRGN